MRGVSVAGVDGKALLSRKRFLTPLLILFALTGLLLCAAPASAAAPRRKDMSRDSQGHKLITPQTRQAINRGLRYLAARQHDDGSFGSGSMYRKNVAVTALCGLAFLSNGQTPGRGKYGRNVQRAVDYILSRCAADGQIVEPSSKSHGPMYGHGFATLFLAEVYGMTGNKELRGKKLRGKLERAVKLLINTQNKEGGWRYHPTSADADISVTVCQIMALRAARNAGIYVPKNTVSKCINYVKKCQNPDGGFRYQLVRNSPSMFPRSAAGVVALYSAGIYKERVVERGISYLMRYVPSPNSFRSSRYYSYGHYYAIQAMWQAGGKYWLKWYPAIRDELLRRQHAGGSWADRPGVRISSICNEYDTAMACLVLQMPENYLPIFKR